ncbi:hypothetical protein A2U01_0089232, partial [Trifolium medium]|nr:hypothetical protein [Trifolium medium]
SPLVLDIPTKMITCCLLIPVSCVHSATRPPPKPPDIDAPAATP